MMSNLSLKRDTPYWHIPSGGGIDLFIPPDNLRGIQYQGTAALDWL